MVNITMNWWCFTSTLPETNGKSAWKWMVGILLSYWGGLYVFRGDVLVSGRVIMLTGAGCHPTIYDEVVLNNWIPDQESSFSSMSNLDICELCKAIWAEMTHCYREASQKDTNVPIYIYVLWAPVRLITYWQLTLKVHSKPSFMLEVPNVW